MKHQPVAASVSGENYFYLLQNGTNSPTCGPTVLTACRTLPWLLGVFYNESTGHKIKLPWLNLISGKAIVIDQDILVR